MHYLLLYYPYFSNCFTSISNHYHDEPGSHAELPLKHHAEELGHIRGSSEDKALSEEISYRAPKVLEVHY
jgi:hypothetical protein